MTLLDFTRLISRNLRLIILFPFLLACIVFLLTMNMPRKYVSGTLIYTGFASGYSITSSEDSRVDYFAVNNAFENILTLIKSREVIEEVSIRLLASHLMKYHADSANFSSRHSEELNKWLPYPVQKKLVDTRSWETTVQNIYHYKDGSKSNIILAMLNDKTCPYSIEHITGNMNVQRKSISDMLEIVYQTDDRSVCQQTLLMIVEVFMRRYKDMKQLETFNVVKYFEEQLQRAQRNLKKAEERLKDFGVNNKIINYDEQTKFIAEAREDLGRDKQREQMLLVASEASLKSLEEKMQGRLGLIRSSESIVDKKQQLTDLNYQIAQSQMQIGNLDQTVELQQKADQLKQSIRDEVNNLYKINYTQEGVQQSHLLNEWLSSYLAVDASKARVAVIEQRLKESDKTYNKYAPLGSTLNRLEREVGIAEKEFLSVLNSLNTSRLRQQNLQMSNNLKIIDAPYLPQKPEASNRILLVFGSFAVGFVLVLSSLVGVEFLDGSVKTPQRAEEQTGLKFLGALPKFNSKEAPADMLYIESCMLKQLIGGINLELLNNPTRQQGEVRPLYIQFLSTKAGEGASWTAAKVAAKLSESGQRVIVVQPGGVKEEVQAIAGNVTAPLESIADASLPVPSQPMLPYQLKQYPVSDKLVDYGSLNALFPEEDIAWENYDYVFVETPSLIENAIQIELIRKMDMSLLVVNARRVWAAGDRHILEIFEKAAGKKPFLVLNQISTDRAEDILGYLPKKRSALRKWVKKLATFNFKN